MKSKVAVIGAGPAGLTAAWCLRDQKHLDLRVYESDSQVGGISKTVHRGFWKFDLGGHRFFSKSEEVNELWDEMLKPSEFLLRPRKSRIFYRSRFFDYPLKPLNALRNLGPIETIRCILSFLSVKISPPKDQSTFEGWVAARFGWRLYRIFFKTYTEKVWGIPTTQLQSTWAAQRIKNLSLTSAILDALGISRGAKPTSLIEKFKYPEYGPGQLWETVSEKIQLQGIDLRLNTSVQEVRYENAKYLIKDQNLTEFEAEAVFSSLPLALIPELLNAPIEVRNLGSQLRFRDFLIVGLPVKKTEGLFDDNWIYIHDSEVRVGRIQNYGSWSEKLVQPGTTCLGMEYFVNEGDELWTMSDSLLVDFAKDELAKIGFEVKICEEVGYVVRVRKAYPVYDESYLKAVEGIRSWLTEVHPKWFQIGRNGQHRYNNQDHSMLTASIAVKNFLQGSKMDYWDVNLGEDYLEVKLDTRESPVIKNQVS